MIPEILLLVKQIRPRTSQVHNLRAPISILLEPGTFKTVECVAYSLPTTDDAFILVIAEGALVADPREGSGPDIGVANGAFAIAFVAEAADADAWEFAAHY
jgi:hypothetical protein